MGDLVVRVKLVREGAKLPERMSDGASGFDLFACGYGVLPPREWRIIWTGLSLCIPAGFECQVRPRSGLAVSEGVTVMNSPGTIDADYRGEVGVVLVNHGYRAVGIEPGDRIAQAVFVPVVVPRLEVVDELDETDRGEGGFGSTDEQEKSSGDQAEILDLMMALRASLEDTRK